MGEIFVGTSGWTYEDWKGVFYPEGVEGARRLEYYAQVFDTVEVNSTFYRLPFKGMIQAWNERLREGFHLVVKGSRQVTHVRKLQGVEGEIGRFFERVGELKHLKVVLWQLPPSLHRECNRLRNFLAQLPTHVRHAVEFRHPSWWHEETYEVLASFGAAFVAVSHPKLPDFVPATSDILYVRFHGLGPHLYRWDYSEGELRPWVERLCPLMEGRILYAFFNNDYAGNAPRNALTFRKMLEEALK